MLLVLLLLAQRRIEIEHALGQFQFDEALPKVEPTNVLLGERHHALAAGKRIADDEQGRRTRSKHHFRNRTDIFGGRAPLRGADTTADQIANVGCTRLKLSPLLEPDLQFSAGQTFGFRNAVNAGKLEDEPPSMRPQMVELELTPASVGQQRGEPAPLLKLFRKVRKRLDHDFAAAALRPENASDGDEWLVSRAGYSMISRE